MKSVDSIIITNSDGGYTTAPNVSFTGSGGAGAAAIATVANGLIVSIAMASPGTGYTSTPNVAFTGGGGSGAMAAAIMSPTTLDAVATTGILDGELSATVIIAQTAYTYQLAAGTGAETAPTITRSDDYNLAVNAKIGSCKGCT